MTARTPARDPTALRAAILVIAGATLALCLFALARVVREALGIASAADVQEISADEEAHRGGRRIVLQSVDDGLADGTLEDVAPEGSVRERWAEASEGAIGAFEMPAAVEALVDPQLSRFHASYDHEAVLPFTPTGRRGRLVSARGLDLPSNASCDVRVLPVGDSTFNCLIRVSCGGVIVYPNQSQTAGYVSCELDGRSPRRARDAIASGEDGDPAITMDLDHGMVTVSDSRAGSPLYDVRIELDSTPLRVM